MSRCCLEKVVIKPGRDSSDDPILMDLFNTSLALGGAAGKIPTDRYIDGIDQTSFLLVDKAASKRRSTSGRRPT